MDTDTDVEDFDFDFDGDYIVDVYNDGRRAVLGTQLVEVFAVKVRSTTMCEGVYGSFYVKDGKHTLCFYNRQPDDCEPVDHQDRDWSLSLSLSGPHRPASATRRVEFSLDLKDKNGGELIKNSVLLNLMEDDDNDNDNDNEGSNKIDELIDNVFDKYLVAEVVGRWAAATIYYTLPRVAAQAEIDFKLVDESGEIGHGHGHVDVCGTVVARYGNTYDTGVTDDDDRFSFVLFHKDKDKVRVKYGESIPMLRSNVAVPRSTSIAFELNLELIHSNGLKEQIQNYKDLHQASEHCRYSHTFKFNYGSMLLDVVWWDTFFSFAFID